MSAKQNFSTEQRQALTALLERFGCSLESFLDLRPDSYEHVIARSSLSDLERLYSELHKPGQTIEETQKLCPPWPEGSPRAGRPPSVAALSQIGERLRTEATLNSLGRVSQFMEKLRAKATSLPIGQQTNVLDTIVTLVGEEMLQAKLGGVPLAVNLDPLDRLLVREDQRRKDKEHTLKHQQFQRETCALFLKWFHDKRARDIAESKGSNEEKIKLLRQTYFADVDALEKSGEVKLPE